MFTEHIRALIFLLVLLLGTMVAMRWLLKGTDLYEGFMRRRYIWLGAMVIAFLIPNFFLAMVVLALYYVWASRKDPQPIGLYVMLLFAVTPVTRDLEGIGPINALFSINNLRLLSIAFLLPLAWRLFIAPKPKGPPPDLAPRLTDAAVLMFSGYLLLLYLPHESITQLMRRGLHLALDLVIPYFVVTRFLKTRADVKDALGAMLVIALWLAPVAIFEHFKGWLLWVTPTERWLGPGQLSQLYVLRDSSVRAGVSSGHPLVLGHFLVVCFGMLAIFRPQFLRFRLACVWVLLALALYSTLSRSPWVAAACVIVLMGLLSGKVIRFYAVTAVTGTLTTVALMFSPWADRLYNLLPFVGEVDSFNVDYRQQLFDTAIIMVRQKPLLGDVFVVENLEHLRQGQGIIDLVNVYAEIAMTYGLIGLGLFLLFLLSGMTYGLQLCWKKRKTDRELFLMAGGACLGLTGSMITLSAISNFITVPVIYTIIVALLVVMARLARAKPKSAEAPSTLTPTGSTGRAIALR
jgi:O-antigen ligase